MLSKEMLTVLGVSMIVVSLLKGILDIIGLFTKNKKAKIIIAIVSSFILSIYFYFSFTYIIELPAVLSGILSTTLGIIYFFK